MKLSVTIQPPSLSVSISPPVCDVDLGTPVIRGLDIDPYEGQYVVTPSRETVVLETSDKRMLDNVTINPIPSNYGLIQFDGAVLTVS